MIAKGLNSEVRLAEEIPTIFESIKPGLIRIAIGYRIPNVKSYVDEWQARAFFIAKKFDDGSLRRKVFADQGGLEGTKEITEEIDFLKLFKSYLKTSFKNDLNKDYFSRRKTRYIDDCVTTLSKGEGSSSKADYVVGVTPAVSDTITDAASIPDILEVVCFDLDKAKKTAVLAVDLANVAFFEALRKSLMNLGQFWLTEPVIRDICCENNKDYFDADFREMLTPRILLYLSEAALAEQSPVVASRISDICLSHAGMAIQRRLYRYFFNYQGGLQKRLSRFRKSKRNK